MGQQPEVRVHCLGHFRIERGGAPLDAANGAQRKPLELLKTLIALGAEDVPESQLIDALWPDSEGDAAQSTFNSTLHRLRKVLGPEALPVRQGRLTLDPHRVRLDTRDLYAALSTAESALAARDPATAAQAMGEALALYRGPFLEGEFEPPEILATRDRLHGRFLRVLGETASALERAGDDPAAIRLYEQGIEADPVAEELVQGLLRAQGRQGHRAEAEAAYRRFRRNLEALGGGVPSPETEELRREALRGPPEVPSSPDHAAPEPFGKRRFPRRWAAVAIATAVLLGAGLALWRAVSTPSARVAPVEGEMPYPLPEPPTLAVLPFANLSGDPDQVFFADGFTDTLITDLSKLQNLQVIARFSVMPYKGQPIDAREVAARLGADYLVEGSVQRNPDRVRVNTQLIDGISGLHIWSDRYDEPIDDLFDIQDRVAQRIITELDVELVSGEQARIWRRGTKSIAAREAYARGDYHAWRFTAEDNQRAIRYFQDAIAADPQFADAYANLSGTLLNSVRFGWVESRASAFATAEQMLAKAESLEPDGLISLTAKAYFLLVRREFDLAIHSARAAVELYPNSWWANGMHGIVLVYSGMHEDAYEYLRKAVRLTPQIHGCFNLYLGDVYRSRGNHEKAIEAYGVFLDASPGFVLCHVRLIAAYVELGRMQEAQRQADRLIATRPDFRLDEFVNEWGRDALPFKNEERFDEIVAALRNVNLR